MAYPLSGRPLVFFVPNHLHSCLYFADLGESSLLAAFTSAYLALVSFYPALRYSIAISFISLTFFASSDEKPSHLPSPLVPNPPSSLMTLMPWSRYLSLRKQQRQFALLATIPSTTIGLVSGVSRFATIESLPTDLIWGIEANYVYVDSV